MSEAEDRDAIHIVGGGHLAWLKDFVILNEEQMKCTRCDEEVPVGMYQMDPVTHELTDLHDTSLSAFYHCALGHWIDCGSR